MNKQKKWKFYETRFRFREFFFHKIIRRNICERFFNYDPIMYFYANQWVKNQKKTHRWIINKLNSKEPFMVARFGNTELCVMTNILKQRLFGISKEKQTHVSQGYRHFSVLPVDNITRVPALSLILIFSHPSHKDL